jgi:enoyl-CoA hydratase/carnithine racemase
MTDHVLTSLKDGVLSLQLNRPEKKNALTDAMYAALADGLERADTDPEVAVVLISSTNDAFTAGNDIADFAAVATGAVKVQERNVGRFLDRLTRLQAPLVAAVPGLAIGVGTTMLLHCDLVLMADSASLATPFVDLALVPEAASSLLLPGRIGHARAFAMFALSERVSAGDALAMGLANRVVPRGELAAAAEAATRALAAKPRNALRQTKRLMRDGERLRAQMASENEIFSAQLKSPEAQQAFAAFAARSNKG